MQKLITFLYTNNKQLYFEFIYNLQQHQKFEVLRYISNLHIYISISIYICVYIYIHTHTEYYKTLKKEIKIAK